MSNTLYIDGHWLEGEDVYFSKSEPVSNDVIWQGKSASKQQVNLAVEAARASFELWSMLSFERRCEYVARFVELLEVNKQELADTISRETGKPSWESKTEVQSMINKYAISVSSYNERTGTKVTEMADGRAILRHRPHGILAVFGPYNFPGHLPNGHIIPALIAGNTVVFKPSELTPLTAQKTVELWQKAGLPKGVLNLVQGGKDTGIALSENPYIDGLLFTGSANTGYQLHKQMGGQPEKILALEMGGNNAMIAHSYKQLDAAANVIIQSAFISAGQRCTCARRLLIPRNADGDALLARVCEVTESLVVGEWNSDPIPFMGSVISKEAAVHLLDAQKHLIDLGAKALVEMKRAKEGTALLSAGIIDVTDINELPDEEYFGPLLTVVRYNDLDEAISIANNTRFGLSVGLLSTDESDYELLLLKARAGIVNWNKPITGASSNAPFGGIGASGNHRPSAYYAADYCSWPMASVESKELTLPESTLPGLNFK
ncbi:succinylglutamate-semialdehyde dehydrogenase [Vibrio viridaestus]|uniref:N-succinylglutamate 5-semialdehyde dehydrogenase n=1 Tax=Vibrio viridaestus TaxID=2487322 RepID=A0A3N9TCL3_9VIBR|nr:succinylglutamate-semialdehyde dehydrogenase [Vibrio viridaestus]RQW61809.1 succinylglutamate-semialdehyde dehydrogenase [Vibrio viridaestus]